MTINTNEKVANFSCRKKPRTPEELRIIDERIADHYTLSGIDRLRAFHQMMGLEFDENIFDKIIEEYSLDD